MFHYSLRARNPSPLVWVLGQTLYPKTLSPDTHNPRHPFRALRHTCRPLRCGVLLSAAQRFRSRSAAKALKEPSAARALKKPSAATALNLGSAGRALASTVTVLVFPSAEARFFLSADAALAPLRRCKQEVLHKRLQSCCTSSSRTCARPQSD